MRRNIVVPAPSGRADHAGTAVALRGDALGTLRHSLLWCALAAAAAGSASAGTAHASTRHAAIRPEGPSTVIPHGLAAPHLASLSAEGEGLAAAPPLGAPPEVVAVPDPPRPAERSDVGPDEPEAGAAEAPKVVRKLELALPIELEVHGRVLMEVSADERDGWDRQLEMSSARLGVEARVGALKTVVEADLASDPLVEDAYVRIDLPRATRLTAGRFKAPFSERRLASSWALPLVTRGLVDRYLVRRNGLGGRRLGVAGALRPWGGRLEATAGFFAGDPNALETERDAGEDWAGRVAVRTWEALELGVSGYRAGEGSGIAAAPSRHAAGAFATLELGAFEATAEGFAGRIVEGPFTAGTALLAWRLRAGHGGRLKITPVAGGEALRLSGATGGVGYGAIAGAVISWAGGLKVKLQGEWARRPGDTTPASALAAEVGTRF